MQNSSEARKPSCCTLYIHFRIHAENTLKNTDITKRSCALFIASLQLIHIHDVILILQTQSKS
jgi:hypothetical protein